MVLQTSFPGPSGVVDSVMARKNLAALVATPGVFSTGNLVTPTATMNVAVAPFNAVLVRGGGPLFIANDGSVNVLLEAAPAANSRIDVIYVMQHENGYGGFADGDNLPVLGVVKGDAAAVPVAKAVPVGALELAQVTLPANVIATNAGGVVIRQTARPGALRQNDWVSWTPRFWTNDGPPTLGNSTLVGRYKLFGTLFVFEIALNVGSSGFSGGTGDWRFDFPTGFVTAGYEQIGMAKCYVNSSQNYAGVTVVPPSVNYMYPMFPRANNVSDMSAARNAQAGGGVGTGVPYAASYPFVAGSNLGIAGSMEMATVP